MGTAEFPPVVALPVSYEPPGRSTGRWSWTIARGRGTQPHCRSEMTMPNEAAAGVDPPASPRVAPSVREVAQLLGLHRNTVYLQIQRGSIPVVYVGTKPLVPRRWIEEQFGALLSRPATVSLEAQPDG